jgi:hypothetical protein
MNFDPVSVGLCVFRFVEEYYIANPPKGALSEPQKT